MHKFSEFFGNSEICSENLTTFLPKFVPKFAISFFFTSELDSESPNALREIIFKRVHGRFQLDPWLRDHVHLRFATKCQKRSQKWFPNFGKFPILGTFPKTFPNLGTDAGNSRYAKFGNAPNAKQEFPKSLV